MRISELETLAEQAAPLESLPDPVVRVKLREAAGVNLAAAAAAIHVAPMSLRAWETGAWAPRRSDHEARYLRLLSAFADLAFQRVA